MTRQRAVWKGISVVVCFVFLWTNCVWASGLVLQQDKLAAPHQVPLVSEDIGGLLKGLRSMDRLGIEKLGDIIKNGQRLDEEGVIAFASLDEETGKWAKYIFGREGVILRIAEDGVNDDFYKLLNKYTIVKEKDKDGEWIYIGEDSVVINAVNNFLGNINSNWRISVSKGVVGREAFLSNFSKKGVIGKLRYEFTALKRRGGKDHPEEYNVYLQGLYKKRVGRFYLQYDKRKEFKEHKKIREVVPREEAEVKMIKIVRRFANDPEIGYLLNPEKIQDVEVWAVDKNDPLGKGHLIVFPELMSGYKQLLNEEAVKVALGLLEGVPYKEHLKIGFNSHGAFSSFNNLHLQTIFFEDENKQPSRMPVEDAQLVESYEIEGIKVYMLKDYPVNGIVFEGSEISGLSSNVFGLVELLQAKNIPHNLIFTKTDNGVYRVYIFPRKFQQPSGFDTGIAFFELGGVLLVKDKEQYDSVKEEDEPIIIEELRKVSLDKDVVEGIVELFRVIKYTGQLYGFYQDPSSGIKNLDEILETIRAHLEGLNCNIEKNEIEKVINGIRKEVQGGAPRIEYIKKFRGELAPIVNDKDEIIEVTDVGFAHIFGLMHRTSNAVVITPKGKVLLQRRAPGRLYPLHVSIFGGHVKYPQSYEEAIREELKGELRLTSMPKGVLGEVGKERYEVVGDKNREWRTLYVYRLTEEEYEEVQGEIKRLEDEKGKKTKKEYEEWLSKQGRGYGEVWSYYEVDLNNLAAAPSGVNGLHYIQLTDRFINGDETTDAYFTPDLLERICRDPSLMKHIEIIVDTINIIEDRVRELDGKSKGTQIVDGDKYFKLDQDVDKWVPDLVGEFMREFDFSDSDPDMVRIFRFALEASIKIGGKSWGEWLSDEDIYGVFYKVLDKYFPDKKKEIENKVREVNKRALGVITGQHLDGDIKDLIRRAASSDCIVSAKSQFIEYPLSIDSTERLRERLETAKHILFVAGTNGGMVYDLLLIQKLLSDNPGLTVTFAVKDRRFGLEVTKGDVDTLLENDRFRELKNNSRFKLITTGSDSPGTNLLDASQEFITAINNADLVIAKGHMNMLSMRLLNKDYFVVCSLGIGDKELLKARHFTGLPKMDEPRGVVAYIPAGIEVASKLDRRTVMGQQLVHFVSAMNSDEWGLMVSNNGGDESRLIEEIKKKMKEYGAPFVMFVKPEILATSTAGEEALRVVAEKMEEKKNLAKAIEEYANVNNLTGGMGAFTISELNQALNHKELEGLPVDSELSRRSVYRVGSKANVDDIEEGHSKSQVIVTGVVLSEGARIRLDVELAKEHEKVVMSPVEVTGLEKYEREKGIFFNFLYYITDNLIDAFNGRKNRQYEIGYEFGGDYIDCLVKGDTRYIPLFNKGAVGVTGDGKLVFGRIKLTTGSVKIGDVNIDFRAFDMVGQEEGIAYTPMYEDEFLKWLEGKPQRTKEEDDELKPAGKKGYKHPRRVRIPKEKVEGRYQIVFINARIIHIRKGETEIPPFGWVLSIPEGVFNGLKEYLEQKEDNVWMLRKDTGVRIDFELPVGFESAETVMGGATLLVGDDNRAEFNGLTDKSQEECIQGIIGLLKRVMRDEGWELVSSRQTQETDVPPLDNRQPRQIIGKTDKGEIFIFSFSGRARISTGATYPEALYIIAKELKRAGKKIQYAFLLDDGGSVSTGVGKDGKYYGLNIVASGPANYVGEVRAVNNVGTIVFVGSFIQSTSHLLPKYLCDVFRVRLIQEGLINEAGADNFIAQISYTDADGVIHIAEGPLNKRAVQIIGEVLSKELENLDNRILSERDEAEKGKLREEYDKNKEQVDKWIKLLDTTKIDYKLDELDKLDESVREDGLAIIDKHLWRAITLNRGVPQSIVDISRYVVDERFVDRWFFYELPAEVFVQDFCGRFLTDEEKRPQRLQGHFFNIGTSKVPGTRTRIMDFLSTNEMEAMFLDLTRVILGQERFEEIIAEVEKWNKVLDEKAGQVYNGLASDNRVSTWGEKIKASILSELIAAGEDEYFEKQMESDESIKVDDSDKFIQQLEKLTGSAGGHYLHVASHHGAVIFDLEIFALDIIKEWLRKNIKGFDKIDWNDTEAVKNKLAEVQSQIKGGFCVTFAVKDKRIAPTDVTIEDIEQILNGERFGLLRVFRESDLFGIVNTGSQTRGMNLNDASEEFVKALNEATLIGIKGGDNTITARLLNKDHFVFGTAIGYGIQRYTGLRFRMEAGQIPAGYMAFIPAGIPATCEVQFSVPPRQNLGQFVIARKKLEESRISYDLVKERMDRGDTFVEAVYPEILGDTDEAKKALRTIRDLADKERVPFNEAIETYVEELAPQDVKSAMFDYTVLELNRAFNEGIVKGIFPEGSYQRASYVLREKKGDKPGEYIGEKISTRDAYQNAGKNRVLVNVLRLTKEVFSKGLFELGGVQASDHDLGLIAPEKVAEDEFKDGMGIIINFLYFFTDRLRKEFNMRSRQVMLEDKSFITGSYIGFQKDRKTGEVFAPLYNKGAIAVFKNGRIEFGRVRLGTGGLTIGDTKLSWVPFDQMKEGSDPEAIAYTPMFDQNMEKNEVTHFGTSYDQRDKETAKTGKATRRILTPPAEGRVSIVIFRNRIIQIREGQAEIPPAGWVLSVRKEIFDEIKGSLERNLIPKEDKGGSEYFVLADGVALDFDYDLPEGWEDAYWIMGGATLTYNHEEGRIPISKVMDIEGWNYNSSRQTQETDLSMVDSRGPRQIICQTMDGDFCIFTFSGRSDMSGGVTHDEALDVIINELKKDGKELAYALNLDGGSSVCMGVAEAGQFYPLNITGKGDNGTCDVRPVNGVAFIRSTLKASSLSKRVVEGKKETVYSSIKVDIFGNILGVEELVKDERIDMGAIQGLLGYLKENFGEGVFGPIREIVIVDNLGGIDSEIPPEQRGGVAYFVGEKVLIDIDAFKHRIALQDAGTHEGFEATLRLVEANPGIQEVTATYCALEALLELKPEDLDSYIEFLKQPDNGLDSGDYAKLLETIREMKDRMTREDLIALSIGYVLNIPRYAHLKDSLASVMNDDIENAREKLELARNIYRDIVEAKKEVNGLKEMAQPVINEARLAKAKAKVKMVISRLIVVETGFVEALLKNNKYIMLDRSELAKPENAYIKDWVERITKGMERSPFIYSDEGIPEGINPEDVIYLIEPAKVHELYEQNELNQLNLYLPLPYSISSIYLAGQVVLAGGMVSEIRDKLAVNTIRALYDTLLGRDVTDAELEVLFRMPWKVLPPIVQISATLDALRKAIAQIEAAA